jgi:hypothetical protein
MIITEEKFFAATGNWPVQDDLERANCQRHGVGVFDHTFCGWCEKHDKPRSQCGECMKAMVAGSHVNQSKGGE